MDPTHIAWAAGLFEGEGCISHTISHGKEYPRLYMKMTDHDVISRFIDIVGYGNLVTVNSPSVPDHYKKQYAWSIHKRSEVIRILDMLLPFFGQRRAYKALNILDDLELAN